MKAIIILIAVIALFSCQKENNGSCYCNSLDITYKQSGDIERAGEFVLFLDKGETCDDFDHEYSTSRQYITYHKQDCSSME